MVPAAVLLACSVAMAADAPRPAPSASPPGALLADVPEEHIASPGSVLAPQSLPREASTDPVPAALEPDRAPSGGAGIAARALQAYRHAENLLRVADPACHLDWELVAAIGQVESHHGSFGGNRLDDDGVARPGIVGIALTGAGGTAHITDTDGGAWDGDTAFDRAVGPMQFIPGTWRIAGSDAEPDGRRDPQDIDDAAAATGVYLCAGQGDLSSAADRYAAVFRYNHSDTYVRTVLAIADSYARGVAEVPQSYLAAARRGAAQRELTAAGAPGSQSTVMTPAPAPQGNQPTSDPGSPSTATSAPPAPATTSPGVVGEALGVVDSLVPAPTTPSPTPTCLDPLGHAVSCPTLPPLLP
jgi:hypothetical protein